MPYLDAGGARMTDCSFRRFFPGERHVTRRFSQGVLLLLLEGTLYFEEEGVPAAVSQGEWYIQRPGLLQTGERGSPSPFYFYIHFEGDFREEDGGPDLRLPLSGRFRRESLLPLLEALSRCRQEAAERQAFQDSLFHSILYLLYSSDQEGRNPLAYQILKAVSSRLDQPFSLSALAEELGYCEDYVGRVFRRQYGVSVGRYLARLRLQKARQLLRDTEKSIRQVGAEVGYPDQTQFYRLFRRETGLSPSQWRAGERGGGRN